MAGKFSVETVFKAIDRISAPIRKIQGNLAGFSRKASAGLASLDKQLAKVHGGVQRIGAATLALGAAGGAAAFAVGKAGAEFEAAITAVGAVGLQTRDQIAPLEAEAKRLGATTAFTATQAANAMETMARAGFSNADILAGVGPILDAASASGLEIAEVANHVSNALKGMGLETREAGRVSDVLALASSRTNSSIGSLGESLSNVASTARQFKIPLEDTVAAVALLQDVGLDASVAGSALNTMLTQMAAPTDAIAKKMKRFGVRFKDARGNMLSFPDVLANISKAAQKSGGNMDQVAFIAELVGLRGQKAAANLKDLFDTGKVQALTEELLHAEGAAKRMAAIRMDNTLGDVELLSSAIDGVKIALFETESGPLRAVIQSMTKWVEVNQELIVSGFQDWMQRIRDNLPEIVTWLKRIGVALAAFYAFFTVVKVISAVATVVSTVATVVGWLSSAFAAVKAAALVVAPIIAGVSLPVLAIGAAIAAVVALAWAFWPQITAFFTSVKDWAVKAVGTMWAWIKDSFVSAKNFIVGVLEFVVGVHAMIWSPVIAFFARLWESVLGVFKKAWSRVLAFAASVVAYLMPIWEPIGQFFAALWSGITELFMASLRGWFDFARTIYAGVLEVWTPIVGFFEGLWDGVAAAFKRIMGPITETVSGWIDRVGGFINKARSVGRGILGTGDTAPQPGAGARDEAPQIVSPQERAAREVADASAQAMVDGKITVEAAPGTKASAKAKPRSVPIVLEPSGAF